MRVRPLAGSVALVLAATLLVGASSTSFASMSPEEKARRAVIVARVGPQDITTGELEDRIAQVPRFQLTTFGATPDAVRHKFLEDIIIPEALFAQSAEAQHLDRQLPTSNTVLRALANAAVRSLRGDLGPATAIPMEDVRKYYEENKARYDSPERYAVWRILCKTREEAVAVTEAARKDLTVAGFTSLAREHSIDKATNQRGGNLGFLGPDGASNEAGLKVDPAIAKAAASVKDGELVAQPVPEGQGFAVVWHRGTVPPVRRAVEDVAPQIRDTLWKHREEQAVNKLKAELRTRDLKELNEGLLNGIEVSSVDGQIEQRHRPGQVPPLNPSQTLPR